MDREMKQVDVPPPPPPQPLFREERASSESMPILNRDTANSRILRPTEVGLYMDHWPGGASEPAEDISLKESLKQQQLLLEGAKFVKYEQERSEVYYVCVTPSGNLHWAATKMNPLEAFPSPNYVKLRDVTQIIKGKNSDIFKKPYTAVAIENRCLSLLTSTQSVDLESSSSAVRDKWFNALHAAIAASGSVCSPVDKYSYAFFPVSEPSKEKKESIVPKEMQSDAEAVELIQFLDRGEILIKHGRKGKPKQRWINCGRGKLFWSEPTTYGHPPEEETDQCIQLWKVSQLLPGKQTEILKRAVAQPLADEVCFSLVTKERTVDFQCQSAEQREQWIKALRFAIAKTKQTKEKIDANWFENRRSQKPLPRSAVAEEEQGNNFEHRPNRASTTSKDGSPRNAAASPAQNKLSLSSSLSSSQSGSLVSYPGQRQAVAKLPSQRMLNADSE